MTAAIGAAVFAPKRRADIRHECPRSTPSDYNQFSYSVTPDDQVPHARCRETRSAPLRSLFSRMLKVPLVDERSVSGKAIGTQCVTIFYTLTRRRFCSAQ